MKDGFGLDYQGQTRLFLVSCTASANPIESVYVKLVQQMNKYAVNGLITYVSLKHLHIMKTSTKHVLFALSFTALLGSCSRPTATFQPSHAQRFYSPQPTATAVKNDEAIAEATPVVVATPETVAAPAPVAVATKADIETMLVKTEAVASAKATAGESRKLARRIAQVREVLAKAPATTSTTNTATKKNSLAQRMLLKHMDNKMKNQLAPDQPQAKSMLTIGLIVGLIGLLLLLIGTGTVATLGFVALIVGIVLVILGLL